MPKALKSCPKFYKWPNLVTLNRFKIAKKWDQKHFDANGESIYLILCNYFSMDLFAASFFFILSFKQLPVNMSGFEPRTSVIGSDRSANWATTTAFMELLSMDGLFAAYLFTVFLSLWILWIAKEIKNKWDSNREYGYWKHNHSTYDSNQTGEHIGQRLRRHPKLWL